MTAHRPSGYHALTPYLLVADGASALGFYAKAFGAEEDMRLTAPDGTIVHADMVVGDSHFMFSTTTPDMDVAMPAGDQWPSVSLALYVEDCDAAYERAIAAGCEGEQPPTDMFWGDRMAKLRDPFGHRWSLLRLIEEVSPEEAQQRMESMGDPSGS